MRWEIEMTLQPPSLRSSSAIIEVAVGVVLRDDGAVLIGQRLPGKPYEGWWECPGGKFEPGEDAAAALARELDEELGITVRRSEPWVVREHVYPHGHVRLHFRRIVDWDGDVHSREGQAFTWQQPDAVAVGPLLPAAIAPIEWLRLPPVYAISDAAGRGPARDRSDDGAVAAWLDAFDARLAAADPPRMLLLREPTLAGAAFERLAAAVLDRAARAGLRLMVSSRHPAELWREAGRRTAGGVHLSGRDLRAADALGTPDRIPGAPGADGPHPGRPDLPCVAASCHDAADLAAAGRIGADFAVCGPVLPTLSHPGAATLGWAGFAAAIAATPVPTYALGGLRPDRLAIARRHGAQGVACQRAAWG